MVIGRLMLMEQLLEDVFVFEDRLRRRCARHCPFFWASFSSDVPGAFAEQPGLVDALDHAVRAEAVDAHAQQHRALDRWRGVGPGQVHDRVNQLAAQLPEASFELLIGQLFQLFPALSKRDIRSSVIGIFSLS